MKISNLPLLTTIFSGLENSELKEIIVNVNLVLKNEINF